MTCKAYIPLVEIGILPGTVFVRIQINRSSREDLHCLPGHCANWKYLRPFQRAHTSTGCRQQSSSHSAKPGETCKASAYRQFDFWLGDWEVFGLKGKKVGESRISLVNKGCTVAEHWTNSSGGEGHSYNAYDGFSRRWHQFWSDDQGGILSLIGGLQGDSMVLEGERPNLSDGKPQKQRITWTPKADGGVRQHWETSDDNGATWQTSFDGSYRKHPVNER